MLTAHTRKVRTYGKSKTRIVNDQKFFDLAISPTKYHSPIRNRQPGARGGESEAPDEDSERDVEEDEEDIVPLRSTVRARPAPLSQINLNNRAASKPKDCKQGSKTTKPFPPITPTAKSRTARATKSTQQPAKRPLVLAPTFEKKRTRTHDQAARGIRSEAPVSSSSTGSFVSAVSSISSISTSSGSVFSPGKDDLFVDDEDDDHYQQDEGEERAQIPRRSMRTRTQRVLGTNTTSGEMPLLEQEAGSQLELDLNIDLRSLKISSGRFDDAPEFHLVDENTEVEMSGTTTVRPVQVGSMSTLLVNVNDSVPDLVIDSPSSSKSPDVQKDDVQMEDEDEDDIIPVPKRRTRKNKPHASRSSLTSSGSSGVGTTKQKRLKTRAGRGRMVVVSPESSRRCGSVQGIEEEQDEKEEEDMIVVLPQRKSPPFRSPSPVGEDVLVDPIRLASEKLATLNLALPDSPLEALLRLCDQPSAPDFSSFLVEHDFALDVETRKTGSNAFRKVGEASYSEVYALILNDEASKGKSKLKARGGKKKQATSLSMRETGLVLKVIPLTEEASPSKPETRIEGDEEDDEVACSLVVDVTREIEITRLMSGMGEGFVQCHGAYVVKGNYPEALLDAWDEFEEQRGSDSVRPGDLPDTQLYALIVLENAGMDLESFEFDKTIGWKQAWGAVMQVTKTLAEGEVKARFEHRDLHEGQVLLRPVEAATQDPADASNPSFFGFKATLVDFGLSRVDHPDAGEPYFTPIPEDVFSGEGDQWDVYRAIRDLVDDEADGNWAGHLPQTNLMWLRHVTRVLLHSTRSLKKPRSKPAIKGTARKLTVSMAASENAEYYELLVQFESLLQQALIRPSMRPRTRQKRTAATSSGVSKLTTMTEFVRLLKAKDWVR